MGKKCYFVIEFILTSNNESFTFCGYSVTDCIMQFKEEHGYKTKYIMGVITVTTTINVIDNRNIKLTPKQIQHLAEELLHEADTNPEVKEYIRNDVLAIREMLELLYGIDSEILFGAYPYLKPKDQEAKALLNNIYGKKAADKIGFKSTNTDSIHCPLSADDIA